MKNLKKALIAGTCSVLLVAGSVAGTMAWLQDTDSVTNTFTVGAVDITLDEKDVDNSTDGKDRDQANTYKIFPGQTYEKDPIVHVDANSEDAWLFVRVENNLTQIEADTTIAAQMAENGWTLVEGETNVFALATTVAGGANKNVFENFTISGTVDNTTLSQYEDTTIDVTAYAVQAEGFATPKAAWDATFGNK